MNANEMSPDELIARADKSGDVVDATLACASALTEQGPIMALPVGWSLVWGITTPLVGLVQTSNGLAGIEINPVDGPQIVEIYDSHRYNSLTWLAPGAQFTEALRADARAEVDRNHKLYEERVQRGRQAAANGDAT